MPMPDWVPAAVVGLKALVEVGAFFLLARAGIWLLCLGRIRGNPIYEGIRFLTQPVERLGALVLPGRPRPAAVAWMGALLLALAWLALVALKARVSGVL